MQPMRFVDTGTYTHSGGEIAQHDDSRRRQTEMSQQLARRQLCGMPITHITFCPIFPFSPSFSRPMRSWSQPRPRRLALRRRMPRHAAVRAHLHRRRLQQMRHRPQRRIHMHTSSRPPHRNRPLVGMMMISCNFRSHSSKI